MKSKEEIKSRLNAGDITSITIVGTYDAIFRIERMMNALNDLTSCGHSIGVYSDDKPPQCIGSFDGDGYSRLHSWSTPYGINVITNIGRRYNEVEINMCVENSKTNESTHKRYKIYAVGSRIHELPKEFVEKCKKGVFIKDRKQHEN